MSKLILFFAFFISSASYSQSLRIMSYNTMCDFCKGSSFFNYSERQIKIKEKIVRAKADIISLQEVRSASQLKELIPSNDYDYITNESFLISFADPSILYNTKLLELKKNGSFWLGPREGKFSLGWKFSVPRQVQWGLFEFKESGQNFYFISSHFDNRIENLRGSAKVVNEFVRSLEHPVIFAGDTNMTPDMDEYKTLTSVDLKNAFDLKKSFTLYGPYLTDKDVCYHKKGKHFPACRVDHVLLKKGTPWMVKSFSLDIQKNFNSSFPSDHRPVIVDLAFQDGK